MHGDEYTLDEEDLSRDLLFLFACPILTGCPTVSGCTINRCAFCRIVQLTDVRTGKEKGAHKDGLLDTLRENPYTYEVPFWRAGRVVEGARLEIV